MVCGFCAVGSMAAGNSGFVHHAASKEEEELAQEALVDTGDW